MTTARLDADVLRTLRKARELLADPARWTRNALARAVTPEHNLSCSPRDPTATCWCLRGALHKVAPDRDAAWRAEYYLEVAAAADIASFNDTATHAQVLAVLDEALHARA
jgi:hypothetical protein